MSTDQSQSVAALNAATDASLKARTAEAVKAATPKRAPAKKVAPKVTPKKVAPKATGRKALTPKERAARPVTATIAAYVEWLDKNRILGPKPLTAAERRAAGIAITLYGAYQTSPERRAARGA